GLDQYFGREKAEQRPAAALVHDILHLIIFAVVRRGTGCELRPPWTRPESGSRNPLRGSPATVAVYRRVRCRAPTCISPANQGVVSRRLPSSANHQPYTFRFRGPRKNHKIKPSSGSSTTTIIQINFFSLETEL